MTEEKLVEIQHGRDYDLHVIKYADGTMAKKLIPCEPRSEETKCHRCYQYGIARPQDYNLCSRCMKVLHQEHNDLCCSCGSREAIDNLCDPCRARRIAEYDAKIISYIEKSSIVRND